MPEVGTILSDRYTVDTVLGKGGMGAVYLARIEALDNKPVAIKQMELKGLSTQELEQAYEQFRREASFLANLDHPNLVSVTDFFSEGESHYLVMTYIEGETLQQKLKRRGRPFGSQQIIDWGKDLCSVLGYLHEQDPPVLFRDLKPSNIMVDKTGRLRLIDFGIARTGQQGTKTSTFLQGTGTAGYSPLEQYGGAGSTDVRSDIYSLGATLYHLATGRIPPDAVARVSQGAVPEPAHRFNPELSPDLDVVLQKCMGVRQGDRPNNIREVLMGFQAVEMGKTPEQESATEDLGVAPVEPPTEQPIPVPQPVAARGVSMVQLEPTMPQARSQPSNLPKYILAGLTPLILGAAVYAMGFSQPKEVPTDTRTPAAVTSVEDKSSETKTLVTTDPPKPQPKPQPVAKAKPAPKPKQKDFVDTSPLPRTQPKPQPKTVVIKPKPRPQPTKKPSYPSARTSYPKASKKPKPEPVAVEQPVPAARPPRRSQPVATQPRAGQPPAGFPAPGQPGFRPPGHPPPGFPPHPGMRPGMGPPGPPGAGGGGGRDLPIKGRGDEGSFRY